MPKTAKTTFFNINIDLCKIDHCDFQLIMIELTNYYKLTVTALMFIIIVIASKTCTLLSYKACHIYTSIQSLTKVLSLIPFCRNNC